MKSLFEIFAPSGSEEKMRQFLKNQFKDIFDEIQVDNIGNLMARSGERDLCIECGMDSVGVMAVFSEGNRVKFSAVGKLKPKDLLGRKIIFEKGEKGEVKCCEGIDEEKMKISDLYVEADAEGVELGSFGAVDFEFSENDSEYTGYMLKNRIGLAAVVEALKDVKPAENISVLFSAQKRLGGRGVRACSSGRGNFEKILSVDQKNGDGCSIIAKDERMVFDVSFRKELEEIVKEKEFDVKMGVSSESYFMENIYLSGAYAKCAVLGISVSEEDDGLQSVKKADFKQAVGMIKEILKRG